MTIIGHTVRTRVPHRGPAPGPAQAQMSVHVDRTLREGLGWFDLCGRARLNRVTDGPQEGGHLTRNRGCDHGLAFARYHQPAIARAQTQLSLPSDRPDNGRQALLSDLQRPAQASRVTVGPGALDQHPTRSRVASLGDRAAPDLRAG